METVDQQQMPERLERYRQRLAELDPDFGPMAFRAFCWFLCSKWAPLVPSGIGGVIAWCILQERIAVVQTAGHTYFHLELVLWLWAAAGAVTGLIIGFAGRTTFRWRLKMKGSELNGRP